MRDQWMLDLKEKQSQPRGEFSLSAKKKSYLCQRLEFKI